jgi:CMP-N,N'-diacetyllegionaminic acid synthase
MMPLQQKQTTTRLRSLLPDKPDITRRQDLPKVYALNGALYLARVDWLKEQQLLVGQETLGYVMSPESSVDIDTPLDWRWVEFLIKQGYSNP